MLQRHPRGMPVPDAGPGAPAEAMCGAAARRARRRPPRKAALRAAALAGVCGLVLADQLRGHAFAGSAAGGREGARGATRGPPRGLLAARHAEGTRDLGFQELGPAQAASLGALKVAGAGMSLLKPLFYLTAELQALGYDREATRAALKEEVRSAPVVIYTYSLSPFCTEAVRLLDTLGVDYKEVVLAPEWFLMFGEGAAKRAELGKLFDRTSMPHVFLGGRSIGGLSEGTPGLLPLYESGELEPALKAVGAVPESNPFGFFLFSGDKGKETVYGTGFQRSV